MGNFMYYKGLSELNEMPLTEIEKKLVGKKIKFKKSTWNDYGEYSADGVYFTDDMAYYMEEPATIHTIFTTPNGYIFKIKEDHGGYGWSFCWIDAILVDKTNDTQDTEKDKKTIICKKGDLVKIKKNVTEEKILGEFCQIPIIENQTCVRQELCQQLLVVCDVIGDRILPYYLEDKYYTDVITTDMVEVQEEDFIKHLEAKRSLGQKNKKILADFKTIDEMKSKIDMKTIKKIYAGSMKRIPNDIKGMEQVIHHWACNKKNLYRFLGNQLFIQKEVEYRKTPEDVKNDKEKLYGLFPGCYYVIKSLQNQEILDNRFYRNYSSREYDFLKYLRAYKQGDKVSKMLDEAFKNEKLNIEFSNIIANNTIKGIVEISIDPMEYMLMSCNKSGWSSCHRLFSNGTSGTDYGQWSAGVFSYMCDEVSLIAFRHDGKLYDYTVNRQKFQAHSKNWRQMVWVDKTFNSFVASRQYPNYIDEIAKTVREMIEERAGNNLGEAEENKWVHTNSDSRVENQVTDYTDQEKALHYNDILHGYQGDLCYKKDIELKYKNIEVGSNPICPNCGKRIMVNEMFPECYICHTTPTF